MNNLKIIRCACGVSQVQAAQKCNSEQNYISFYENEPAYKLKDATLQMFSSVYHCDAERITDTNIDTMFDSARYAAVEIKNKIAPDSLKTYCLQILNNLDNTFTCQTLIQQMSSMSGIECDFTRIVVSNEKDNKYLDYLYYFLNSIYL